jgi:class 3 adenylate cyclase/tetratricopeptide (TPR) repeat protein
MAQSTLDDASRLRPYVAGLSVDWLVTAPRQRHRRITGSLAFVDISGFTTLTERLAAKGKAGAEEMSDLLDGAFATLLEEAYGYGASLVKWGGDAVLLLFEGSEHAPLAARASWEMQRTMRRIGRLRTSVGAVQLRMSVGVHSGDFDFFVGGTVHRELVVVGEAATTTALMEQTAEAGEVVVSPATAALLPPRVLGLPKQEGLLLRGAPDVAPRSRGWPGTLGADAGRCLDPAIRDHLLMEVGEGEHRQVAVGFVEVSGVDELLRVQGPGATAAALHQVLSVVQEECAHHRVTFWETDISVDGFKVMLVAGAPRRTGHDEEGMLRAARGILDRHRGPVRVRIGANCGRVFSGGFGPPFRRTWSVKGDAVNLAARVMGKAGDAQLLATAALLDRVPAGASVRTLPPFHVKGKRHPVQASVVDAVTATTHGPADPDRRLVGRATELSALRRWAAGATGGAGAAVLVLGDPGSGKSRLVAELLRDQDPAHVLRCSGDDFESATPYFVLGGLLRAALGLRERDSDDQVVAVADRLLDARLPSQRALLPLLASALGVEREETAQSAAVQESFRGARLVHLVVDLLAAARPGACVLVVEDVHAADEASAEVLAGIAAAASARPWLLLLVGRSAPVALRDRAELEQLVVPPLPADEARSLALASGGEALPAHVLRDLVDRAEGNPLFLLELTAAVRDGEEELPGSLEELLVARIDDVEPAGRQVLRVASVLGSRVPDADLRQLLGTPVEEPTWRALDHFLAADGDDAHRFRSGLVRDAAYEGLPFRRRVELHGRAADALLARAVADEAEHATALSRHSHAALRYDEAWRWSVLAGRRAQAVHANAEALVLLGRARAAGRRLPDLDPAEHATLLEALGDVHARLADLEPAVQAYREARRRAPAGQPLLRARVALSTGLVAERAGQTARASRWLTTAARDIGAAPDTPAARELSARITVERAFLQHTAGREASAAQLCRDAMEQAERAGAVDVVGRALLLLEWIDLWTGGAGDEQRVMRALELFEECGDLPREGGAWNQLGMAAYFRGEWDLAVERYRQAQQVHGRSADEWSVAIASANIAEILVDQGRLDEAEPLVVEALRVWRASGTPSDVGWGAALLGRLTARRGEHATAMALLSEAAASFGVTEERIELVDVALRLTEALLLQGSASAAVERLADAEERLRDAVRAAGMPTEDGLPLIPHAVALLRLGGCAAAQAGDDVAGRDLLDRAVEHGRRVRSTHELALALRARAWLDGDSSDEAARLLQQLGVVWAPELPRHARPAALL